MKFENDSNNCILWIDWGHHPRTRTLSTRLGVELEEICFGGLRLSRYFWSVLQTAKVLRTKQPRIVIATNPSIVLGYLLLALRSWCRFKLVADAHYLGVMAGDGSKLWQRVLNFYNSRVDLVIVTNENHARFLTALGTQAAICEDPLPILPALSSSLLALPPKAVFLICSFDIDEPYEAAFAAFEALQGDGYRLYVSGNYHRARIDPDKYPWVQFLGFLSEKEYYLYLQSCSVVLDLTTLEDCLVCGGYEALAAGKALVLSNTAAIASYFGSGVMLTENTAQAIRDGVVAAQMHQSQLEQKAECWVAQNQNYMAERITNLRARLLTLESTKLSSNSVM